MSEKGKENFKFGELDKPMPNSGIVTVSNWTMASDGDIYTHFFCRHWLIVTDKMMGKHHEGFRSSEKWQLVAFDGNGNIVMIIPGCKVDGFVACDPCPERGRSLFNLTRMARE